MKIFFMFFLMVSMLLVFSTSNATLYQENITSNVQINLHVIDGVRRQVEYPGTVEIVYNGTPDTSVTITKVKILYLNETLEEKKLSSVLHGVGREYEEYEKSRESYSRLDSKYMGPLTNKEKYDYLNNYKNVEELYPKVSEGICREKLRIDLKRIFGSEFNVGTTRSLVFVIQFDFYGQKYEVSKRHTITVLPQLPKPPVMRSFSGKKFSSSNNWYFGDLHVHTLYTDCDPGFSSDASIQHRYDEATVLGLDWMSLTDHSYCFGNGVTATEDWNNMKNECDVVDNQHPDFVILPSEELSVGEDCPDGLDNEILCLCGNAAHLGAHYLENFIANTETSCGLVGSSIRCPSYPGSQEGINLVDDQGGFSIINHPYGSAWDWESIDCVNGETGIEIWNGNNPNSEAIGLWRQRLLAGERVYGFSGSDTESGDMGERWVFNGAYISGSFDRDNLAAALKQGHSYISNGPALILWGNGSHSGWDYEKCLMGNTISALHGEKVTLKIYHNLPESGTITIHKGVISEDSEDVGSGWPKSYSKSGLNYFEIEDTPTSKTYYRAEFVSGAGDYRAFTNPLWVTPTYRIAVTEPYYDEMQDTLDTMNYEYETIDPSVLTNYDQIKMYDIIFVNCAGGLEPIASSAAESVRQFVDNGGVLYASDWAFTFLENSFPGYVDFIGYVGETGAVTGDVIDAGLADHLGANTIPLVFDLGGWVPIDGVSDTVRVYVMGDVTYWVEEGTAEKAVMTREMGNTFSIAAYNTVTEYKPIVVGFEHGNGTVIYTSFHHRAQGQMAAELMKYLALTTVTEDLAKENKEILEDEGYEVVKDNRGMINQSETVNYTYTAAKGETFKILLNWAGSTLKLAVYDPNGILYDEIESDTPPIGITVKNAQSTYSYEVTGMNVPYDNYEYVATVGKLAPAPSVFDTEAPANPYPSIMGAHNGTIKLNQTINVSKLYTYPCAGTGGHAEYAQISNQSWSVETLPWDGYQGDWHNLSFDAPFTLYANETYNYTIRTSSYPQIHHNETLLTGNGWINCTEFTDANGVMYDNWIPAVKFFW